MVTMRSGHVGEATDKQVTPSPPISMITLVAMSGLANDPSLHEKTNRPTTPKAPPMARKTPAALAVLPPLIADST